MRTELQQMATVAQQINTQAADMQSYLSKLIGDLTTVSDTWKGTAAIQFATVRDQIAADGQKLQQQLAGISAMLTQSQTAYANTNDTVSARMKGLNRGA